LTTKCEKVHILYVKLYVNTNGSGRRGRVGVAVTPILSCLASRVKLRHCHLLVKNSRYMIHLPSQS